MLSYLNAELSDVDKPELCDILMLLTISGGDDTGSRKRHEKHLIFKIFFNLIHSYMY